MNTLLFSHSTENEGLKYHLVVLELVLSCRHKDTDTRLSSFAWGGGIENVYKIWIVTSLLLSPKERGAWLERWGVSGSYPEHLHSWHFYIACRNFTAFGRYALENSAKHCKRHASTLTHPLFSFPQGSKLYVCSTCVTLHCLESSISLCFSGRRAGLLEWTALHYNSTQMLPLEVWIQNSSKSLKCSVSMSLLQQFSVVGPLILLVIHLSSLSKALCLHYPRSNATANSLFHISVRHTSSCKPAAEMSTCGLKWCCMDMNRVYINLPRPNGL